MDITQNFKASVMAVKVQRKGDISLDKNRILPAKSKLASSAKGAEQRDGDFAKQAKDVCQKITTLRNLLLENRSAYMRIGQHLKNSAHMTDQQRDLIDRESEKFVAYYTQHLAKMRSDWGNKGNNKPQQRQHIEAVLELLTNYLRNIQQIYQDQKKYRVQHELETYRLLKLAADKKKIPVRPAGEHSGKRTRATFSSGSSSDDLREHDGINDLWDDDSLNESEHLLPSLKPPQQQNATDDTSSTSIVFGSNTTLNSSDSKTQIHSTQQVALHEDINNSQQLVDEEEAEAAKKLSPEDIQMFEQENVQLYHELQGLSEEVELIEKNVVDIAQLQDIFTEKVSMQQHNIERITNAVIGATENVKDANEQIKQAILRNAGLRVWSLFFLLVMSFALLFLDWYYD